MATIADVARHAGVGVGTVSRVLNGTGAVAEATRERVTEAMEALDYRPSRSARDLRRGRTQRIAVVVSFFTHPSAVQRLRGISEGLGDSGYEVVLYPVDRPEQRAVHMDLLAGPHQADGVIVVSLPPTDEEVGRFAAAGVPVVQVDGLHPAFLRVVCDDVEGGRLAGRHLTALGHRDVAFVGDAGGDPYGFRSSLDRRIGLAEALAEVGADLPAERVRTGPHGEEEATALARELLGNADRPSAIFAASDTQALGVRRAAAERGLHLPEDLSLIGFDDIDVAAHVGLSTVRQPLVDSGRTAATLLLEALAGDGAEPRAVVLPLEVIARDTTAPVGGHPPPARTDRPGPNRGGDTP